MSNLPFTFTGALGGIALVAAGAVLISNVAKSGIDVYIKQKKAKDPNFDATKFENAKEWIDIPADAVKDSIKSVSACISKSFFGKEYSSKS